MIENNTDYKVSKIINFSGSQMWTKGVCDILYNITWYIS